MSDKNFSWGILGLIVGIIAPLLGVMILAITGDTEPVTVSALISVTFGSVTALAGVMNPSRKFDGDTNIEKDILAIKRTLQ